MVVVISGKSPTKAKTGRRKVGDNGGVLTIPMEVSSPSNSLGDYVLMIYGEKKIGKFHWNLYL